MNLTRLIPVFSLTFIAAYQVDDFLNAPLIRYYPDAARWSFGQIKGLHNTIGWFGWMLAGLLAAIVVTAIFALIPQRITERIRWNWVWIVPVMTVLFALYIVVVGWWIT